MKHQATLLEEERDDWFAFGARIGLDAPEEVVNTTKELDKRLRTYPLAPGDTVVVIGGYRGWTCGMLMDNYPGIEVLTWEPQREAFLDLLENEGHRSHLRAFNYGLGAENGTFEMTMVGSDFCTFVAPYLPDTPESDRAVAMGELRRADEVFEELDLLDEDIALMQMNIEGYEYYLLPYLVDRGIMPVVRFLTVHFHGCRTQDRERGFRAGPELFEALGRSHIWSWGYGGGGISGWRRRGEPPVDYRHYDNLARRGCDGDEPYVRKVIRGNSG